jgi:type III pantothenate kinase
MNLIIDVGNTQVKLAVFNKTELIYNTAFQANLFVKKIKGLFKKYPKVEEAMISSVGKLEEKDISVLSVFCKVYVLGHDSKTPYKNSYATPQTLGVDRIGLATAAFYFNPQRNTLVIDAGTCVTYDMVNDYGEYLGGAISPGLSMRYKALHDQTLKLPLLKTKDPLDFIGNSTDNCIHSGVVNGICVEIDGIIDQYRDRFVDLTVILTGGDSQFLSKRLKNTIFAHSNFLLLGLNYLLEYNKR